jgi:hypothetical protein
MKCTACSSTALVEGSIVESGSGDVSFKPTDLPLFKSMFGIGTRPVRAYACTHCSNLQLAVEFREEDLKRYQQFEGRQPSLMERLGEKSEEEEP